MRPREQTGFTLVEVMIAITIMALLSLMAWRGLDGVSRANRRLESRTEDIARLMRALDQMERDLALRVTTELPSREFSEVQDAPSTAAPPPVELLPSALRVRRQVELPFFIEIIRAAPAAPGYWQRVQWWQRGHALYRAAGTPATSFPLPAPDTSERVAVLDDIAAVRIRAWEPGQGWRNLPAVASARASTTGLEWELGIRNAGDGALLTYRRVFPLD
jgi:general secretion pathway protein J